MDEKKEIKDQEPQEPQEPRKFDIDELEAVTGGVSMNNMINVVVNKRPRGKN